jgi:vacuolar-type H+-ATPase subunit H
MGEEWIMANAPTTEPKLSPLDQIRHMEAQVTRQIAAAREAAKQTVANTKNKARETINEAREAGRRQGQKRYKDIISDGEEEAQILIARAYKSAETLQRRGSQCLNVGVRRAINIIISADGEGQET